MKILITGDSKLSCHIINALLDKKHRITVVNKDRAYCQQLAEQYGEIEMLIGDSTELPVLEESKVKKYDLVIAMSLFDSENFVICELCKKKFQVHNMATIVNCPRNIEIFQKLGVNSIIDINTFILSYIN